MFSYYPSYATPYTYNPYEAGYARALAEERVARNQYAAAVRAQEEARNRAARARLARQAFANASLYDEADLSDEDCPSRYYHPAYSSAQGLSPQQRYALAELERERELKRCLAVEEERRRQVAAEEERRKRLVEEEMTKRAAEEAELNRRRRQAFEQLYRDFGMRTSREHPELNTARRARTASPPHTRPAPPINPERPQSVRIPVSSPEPAETAEQIAAAEKIQTLYRAHTLRRRALQTIADIDSSFQTLKSEFTLPQQLDFANEGDSHITIDASALVLPVILEEPSTPSDEDKPAATPKLAYTSNNASLHQYDEELNRLLVKLDEVESGGDRVVREQRRDLVRAVEKEAQRIEMWREAVWKAHQEAQVMKVVEVPMEEEQAFEVVVDNDTSASDAVIQPQSSENTTTNSLPVHEESVTPMDIVSSPVPDSQPFLLQHDTSTPATPNQSQLSLPTDEITSSPVLVSQDILKDSSSSSPSHAIEEEADVIIALSDSDSEAEAEVANSLTDSTRSTHLLSADTLTVPSPLSDARSLMDRDSKMLDEFVLC